MPTAFCAKWSNGENGPIIGAYAEYDATPAISKLKLLINVQEKEQIFTQQGILTLILHWG